MRIEIKGSIPSKKNSKQLFRNRRTGKTIIASSDIFQAWHDEQLWLLKAQRPGAPIEQCHIFCNFYLPDNRRTDLDNKFSSIADLLVDAGFIVDDSWQCVPYVALSSKGIDKANPRVIIHIDPLK